MGRLFVIWNQRSQQRDGMSNTINSAHFTQSWRCGEQHSRRRRLSARMATMIERLDLVRVIDRAVGVYGTAPTCFLSALARVPDFTIEDFTTAIAERRLVRIRAMRYSVHTFPAELTGVAAAATRSLVSKTNPYRQRLADRYDYLVDRVDEALAGGPLPAVKIRAEVDPEGEIGDLFNVLLGMAAADFRIVRATTTGTWRSDRFLYARWGDWLPDVYPDAMDDHAARRELVRRYVAAYGPVEVTDVKWWTGWKKDETLEAVDGVDLDQEGDALSYLDGVRLLPVWDVLMVAYRNRDRLYDPSFAPLVHDRFGNATSVVLDQGRVVGQWDLGSNDDPLTIRVAPFTDWPQGRWQAVEEQAARIAKLIGAHRLEVVPVAEPVDLLDSSRNRFLAPLSGR
jgi:hypothetical protein